ncbi:MAG: hypothetical protein KAX77_02595 [Xanthomonadales bacterium]|nr:hypothetical protein [Xanthomonadales bacterium]
MAVGLNADTESLQRTGIPSGGAGTLSDGGFTNSFAGIWVYRDSADVTYALTAGGAIIHYQAGAREVSLGFDSAGSILSDLSLRIVYNSGGGSGTPAFFGAHAGDDFLDEWVYYFIYDSATDGQVAGYIRLADLATAVTLSRANDNAGSQYINTLTFGNNSSNNAVVLGNYSLGRALYASGITLDDVKAWAADSAPDSDWGFWPLADNTDTGDDSGNGRTITFNGTLTSESDPTFDTASTISPAAGVSTTSTLTGRSTARATPSAAAGVSTTGTLAGSDASAMAPVPWGHFDPELVPEAWFSPQLLPIGWFNERFIDPPESSTAAITPAAGASTTSTLTGRSTARATPSAAAGTSTTGTLVGSDASGATLDAILVGTRGTSISNTVTTGSGTSTVSGSSFLIAVSWDAGVTISSVSDSKSNTYTAVGTPQNDGGAGSGGNHQFYVCENGTGGSSHTATVNFSGTAYPTVHLIEITGASAAPEQDIAVQTQDAGTPFTHATGTLAQANEVIVAMCGANIGSAGAYASSNFTILSDENDVSQYWGSAVAKLVVSSTSSVTPSFTRTNSSGAAAVLAISFFETASGPSTISAAAGVSTTATLTGRAIHRAFLAPKPTIGVHTLLGIEDGSGSDPETTSAINTQASGSSLVTFTAGYSNNTGGPSDSEGNTWTHAGTEVYTGYGGQFDVRGYYVEVAVGDTGHTVTFQADGTPAGEMTIPFIEIRNAGKLVQVAQNYPAAGSALTSGNVTTTGPAVLLALWWGDATGLTHTASPNNGFSNIESFGNLPPNSAVQCFVAAREVEAPGTYNVTWTETPDQGAPLWLFAFQNIESGAKGLSTTSTLTGRALKRTTPASAAGASTTSTLTGRELTSATPAAAAGVSTTSTLTGRSTARATVSAAAGTSTTGTLVPITGASTIAPAAGVSTTSTLTGRSTARATPTAAAGASTAATLTGGATARATVSPAAGTSTTGTLVPIGGASTISPAAGVSTTATLTGRSTAQATPATAAGASTTGTLAGAATARATPSAAAGASTTSTLTGGATFRSTPAAAAGASTAATLTGAATARGTPSQANGQATTGTLAGSATARATPAPAAGQSTTGTLVGDGLVAGRADVVPAAGSSTTATLVGRATARATVDPAAGQSTTGTLTQRITAEAPARHGGATKGHTLLRAQAAAHQILLREDAEILSALTELLPLLLDEAA